jgi:hypothetical protein
MLLFKVEQTFVISGTGLVLIPGLGNRIVPTGSKIKVVRPDKSELLTTIHGITFKENTIVLNSNTKKEDVPVGSEIWLLE